MDSNIQVHSEVENIAEELLSDPWLQVFYGTAHNSDHLYFSAALAAAQFGLISLSTKFTQFYRTLSYIILILSVTVK